MFDSLPEPESISCYVSYRKLTVITGLKEKWTLFYL